LPYLCTNINDDKKISEKIINNMIMKKNYHDARSRPLLHIEYRGADIVSENKDVTLAPCKVLAGDAGGEEEWWA
jgi:hypothetical protein